MAGEVTVYTSLDQLDRPQIGDLVVVVWDGAPDTEARDIQGMRGYLCVLVEIFEEHTDHPWWVEDGPELMTWVHAIRRPTEAELAAWVLAQPGGTHG